MYDFPIVPLAKIHDPHSTLVAETAYASFVDRRHPAPPEYIHDYLWCADAARGLRPWPTNDERRWACPWRRPRSVITTTYPDGTWS
jgi:hypothetical protein